MTALHNDGAHDKATIAEQVIVWLAIHFQHGVHVSLHDKFCSCLFLAQTL